MKGDTLNEDDFDYEINDDMEIYEEEYDLDDNYDDDEEE